MPQLDNRQLEREACKWKTGLEKRKPQTYDTIIYTPGSSHAKIDQLCNPIKYLLGQSLNGLAVVEVVAVDVDYRDWVYSEKCVGASANGACWNLSDLRGFFLQQWAP